MRKDRNDPQYHPDMPPVDTEYLLGYLWEVGPTMAAGGYPGPVTHQELHKWMALTGIDLHPWQVRFLRRLSGEYIAESQRAEKFDCPAPWKLETDPAVASRNLKHHFRNLANL